MTGNDDSVLEYLGEKEVALSPRGLDINLAEEGISISYRTIHRRLKALNQRGLVYKVDEKRGWYAITEKGRAYLDGDLDASELKETPAK